MLPDWRRRRLSPSAGWTAPGRAAQPPRSTATASSVATTSPYFASMSNSAASCGPAARVGDALARHDHPVAVLERVDDGRAHAARRRRAAHDDGVGAVRGEHRLQRRAEERGGEQLLKHRLARPRRHARVDPRPARAGRQRAQGGHLGEERRRHARARLVVLDRRERDRRARRPRRVEQPRRRRDRGVGVAPQRRVGIREALGEVDDHERRPLARAGAPPEPAVRVPVRVAHRAAPGPVSPRRGRTFPPCAAGRATPCRVARRATRRGR